MSCILYNKCAFLLSALNHVLQLINCSYLNPELISKRLTGSDENRNFRGRRLSMINYTEKSTYCDWLVRAQGFWVPWADKRSPQSSLCHLSIKAWSKEIAWVIKKYCLQTYYLVTNTWPWSLLLLLRFILHASEVVVATTFIVTAVNIILCYTLGGLRPKPTTAT